MESTEDIKEFNKEIDDGLGDLKIVICATHGYGTEGKFESIKKYLCEKYPQCEGNVEWKDFPVPRMVSIIGEVVKYIYILAIVLTLGFSYMTFDHPTLALISSRVKENRFKILMLCYLSFAIISNTISTGAFEVYFDNSLVFSKLQKYRYPSEEDIERLLVEYVQKKE